MIVKERSVPVKIIKLEALLRRLPAHHGKRALIEEELAIARAGFRGEQSIDFYLKVAPNPQHFFFHDLRLKVRDQFFQIDTLLVAPRYILIIELKNIAGTILFEDQFQQMIRTLDEKEERFPNPILQTARQKLLLEEWLIQHNLPKIAVQTVTVFTNHRAIIQSSSPHSRLNQQIIQMEQLPYFLTHMDTQLVNGTLTAKELQKLSSSLIKRHIPPEIDILHRFQINKSELIKGIHCPQCSQLSMVRDRRKWQCPLCAVRSRDAHLDALKDYSLLLGKTITNREFREFLQISCPQLAHYLLRSLNAVHRGKNKGRVYLLNPS